MTAHLGRARACLAVLLALVLVGVAAAGCSSPGNARSPQTLRFVIPTGARVRSIEGKQITLMPARLVLHVGDRIEVRNDDSFNHTMGPYFVKAHSNYSLEYQAPGHYVGTCTFTPTGRYEIDVRA